MYLEGRWVDVLWVRLLEVDPPPQHGQLLLVLGGALRWDGQPAALRGRERSRQSAGHDGGQSGLGLEGVDGEAFRTRSRWMASHYSGLL